jgi:hypothetical protein
MLVIVMGLLGIPIWFAVGLAVCLVWRKQWVKNTPDAFPCAVRVRGGVAGSLSTKWSKGVGRWERDVFILVRVPGIHPFAAMAVDALVAGDVRRLEDGAIRRMGEGAMVFPYRLASGPVLEIAVMAEHVSAAEGPFEASLPMAA